MFKNAWNLKKRFIDKKIDIRNHDAHHAHEHKNHANLYLTEIKCFLESSSQNLAKAKLSSLLRNLYDIENTHNQIIFQIQNMEESDAKTVGNPRFHHPWYFTSEEIATLWHFPQQQDKVPHILRILSKKARPPL